MTRDSTDVRRTVEGPLWLSPFPAGPGAGCPIRLEGRDTLVIMRTGSGKKPVLPVAGAAASEPRSSSVRSSR